jgi:BirA family biotin operon repressor/biotin-[acetyl-CoA-carboxylase] ligase
VGAKRFRIHSFDSLPSTQIAAREWCELNKDCAGNIFHADEQTAGYGRRGREWQSPQGNLFFTLIDDFKIEDLNWIGYAMGLGLYDAVKKYIPDAPIHLKWPNDLLLEDAKLSGMLLEVADDKILIGLGVNVATAPESDQKTAALSQVTDYRIPPRSLLMHILECYEHWRQIGLEQGFPALRDIWMKRAIWLGETVTARLADGRVLTGQFAGLDDTGALVLTDKTAHHVVTSADIYLKTRA